MSDTSSSRLDHRLAEFASKALGWVDGKGMYATECSPANKKARDKLRDWMREDGLEVTTDQIGNIIGILKPEGCPPNTPPVIIGSHIDTVPGGGKYDGRYGVLAGLEVAHRLKAQEIKLNRPLIVAAWTAEESAYFQPSMPGSHCTAHPHETDEWLEKCKSIEPGRGEDWTLGKALESIGEKGAALPGFFLEGIDLSKAVYLEAHIEQGKLLEKNNQSIGVVTAIYGSSQSKLSIEADSPSANVAQAVAHLTYFVNKRVESDQHERGTVGSIEKTESITVPQAAFQITFTGEADHAGGRPMIGRQDAAYAAASLVERMGESLITENLTLPGGVINRVPDKAIVTVVPSAGVNDAEWKENLETTAKTLSDERGVTFVIRPVPGYEKMTKATMTTDRRDIRNDHIVESEKALNDCIKKVSAKYGVTISSQQGTQVNPVQFDQATVELLKAAAAEAIVKEAGGEDKIRIMPSGPFHDAMKFGAIMPAAMIFVPSVNGLSHNKDEYTHPKDLDLGVEVLTAAVRKLMSAA